MCVDWKAVNTPEVKELRHKRSLIKSRIRTKVKHEDYGKEAQDLYKKYKDLTVQLESKGFIAPTVLDFLNDEFWENKGATIKTQLSTPKKKPVKKINNSDESNYYIFNLSWTESDEEMIQLEINNMLKKIQKYLNYRGLKEVSTDDTPSRKEHTIRYELQCTKNEFNIIKNSAQFMIDNFNTFEFTKRNIAVYGKLK